MEAEPETNDQLTLFDESEFFLDALVQGIDPDKVARYAKHTGKTTMHRPKLIEQMIKMAAGGASNRAIARVLCVSRHTVQAVLETLEAQQKLAPQKERMLKVLRNLVHEGCCQLSEAIADGLLPATQLSIPLGIMFDKMLLAEGSPTSRVEHVHIDVSPEAVNAWLDSLPAAQVTAIDTVPEIPALKQIEPRQPAEKLGFDGREADLVSAPRIRSQQAA